jgi:two-component system response regulator HydG
LIYPDQLPPLLGGGLTGLAPGDAPGATPTREPSQKVELIAALQQTGGNQSQAARILGVNRMTVANRIRKYGIDVGKYRAPV